jgi:hypothetical protein
VWHCYEIATSLPLKSDCRLEIGPRSLCDWWRRKVCSRRSFRFIMVVEYEPLDELIATPPFTRCACFYRLPIHLWVSGRVALLRNTPRLSLSNPTAGGPSQEHLSNFWAPRLFCTIILRRALPPLMPHPRSTGGPRAPRNGRRGDRGRNRGLVSRRTWFGVVARFRALTALLFSLFPRWRRFIVRYIVLVGKRCVILKCIVLFKRQFLLLRGSDWQGD